MKKSTPTYMVYGEFGLTPIAVDIKNRLISYWAKLVDNSNDKNNTKLASRMYLLNYSLYSQKLIKSPWFDHIKDILCTSGFSGIWYCQSFLNVKWLTKSTHQKLKDLFVQNWYADIAKTSNTNFYKVVKTQFEQTSYIRKLPIHLCKHLIAFRTRNHRLPIELGRWRGIPANERRCPYCSDIGDEYHYILICPKFTDYRKKYIKRIYCKRPNIMYLRYLFSTDNYQELKNLSIFCSKIISHFKKL